MPTHSEASPLASWTMANTGCPPRSIAFGTSSEWLPTKFRNYVNPSSNNLLPIYYLLLKKNNRYIMQLANELYNSLANYFSFIFCNKKINRWWLRHCKQYLHRAIYHRVIDITNGTGIATDPSLNGCIITFDVQLSTLTGHYTLHPILL